MYNPSLHFHFIGIGGSGMSGLAEILLSSGFIVSGSDLKRSHVVTRLEKLGAVVSIGHRGEHVSPTVSLVVYSSAVDPDNPEMVEARQRAIPTVRRAEVLAELMRLKFGVGVAGSHGKTTTTSMCAAILEGGKLDPTIVIGGQVRSSGTGARLGHGKYLVAETDESDRSFLLMKPTIAVVTNIDDEHMNAYASRQDLEQSFETFVESVPFYGLAVLCIDDPVVRRISTSVGRRVVTYGFSEDADIRAVDVVGTPRGMHFDVQLNRRDALGRFHLPMLGRHLVQNSLAAIAVGLEFGLEVETIRAALSSFKGVKRRLEVVGEARGVSVVDDYGHHPTEIRASLRAVRECFDCSTGRVIAVFQPHRFSRMKSCWDEFVTAFGDADHVVVTEIYAAGEAPIPDVSGELLCAALHHPSTTFVEDLDHLPREVEAMAKPGDVVVCLGAGSIGQTAGEIVRVLASTCSDDASVALEGVLAAEG